MDNIKSLTHTKWNCKYPIVFAPKYRRKVFYEEKRLEIGAILRELCRRKGVEIIEAEVCPDHIHMLVSIPPKMSVSGSMGFLKGKSSLMICQRWGSMKFKYRNRQFWCRGYHVDTVTYFYGHFYCREMICCGFGIIMLAVKICAILSSLQSRRESALCRQKHQNIPRA